MNSRLYLPSIQFSLIAVSLAMSAGLILGAQWYAAAKQNPPAAIVSTAPDSSSAGDWRESLAEVQAQNPAGTLPETPSQESVAALTQASQNDNVTQSVGKSLLINLVGAKTQGLGSDIPTQNQILAGAAALLQSGESATLYTAADIAIVPASTEALKAYGNDVMETLSRYPAASERATLLAVDSSVEAHDLSALKALGPIGKAYSGIATALLQVAVPQTLAPLHLQIVNDFSRINAAYADMQKIVEDPLRGLGGLQRYESLMDEEARAFTTIAQQLARESILFTKDEPGASWSALLPAPQSLGEVGPHS